MDLKVRSQVGAGHVLCAAHVTDEPFVPKVHGTNVTCHILVGLEGGTTVLAREASSGTVGAAVILIQAALVKSFMALVAAIAALVGVQNHVVSVCLQAL